MSAEGGLSGPCLDPETLAAFIDGRLTPAERAQVEAHLASCMRCYEIFVDSVEASRDAAGGAVLTPASSTASAPASGSAAPGRRWIPPFLAMAAVAVIALVLWQALYRIQPAPADPADVALATLARATDRRVALGQLGTPFPWAPVDRERGAGDVLSVDAREAIVAIDRLAGTVRNPATLHANGMARLVEGRLDEAIASLEQAIEPASPPAYRADLAAALLERHRRTSETLDAARALDQASQALQADPKSAAALFNRALALTALKFQDDAAKAWRAYLDVDASSPWATEARERLRALEAGGSPAAGLLDPARGLLPEYRAIEAALAAWDPDAAAAADWTQVRAMAARIQQAGGDAQLVDLVAAVEASAGWSADRRRCLADGLRNRAASTAYFDAVNYTEARASIARALASFSCARVRALDGELQREQVEFFATRDPAAVARIAQIEAAARQSGYLRVVGRSRHVRGLAAFRAGAFSDAAEHYRVGQEAFAKAGDPDLGAAIAVLAAELLNEQGDRYGAWRVFERAFAALPSIGAFRRKQTLLVAGATAGQRAGLPGAALFLAEKLIALGDDSGNAIGVLTGHLQRARAAAALGRTDLVHESLARAEQARTRIPDEDVRRAYGGDIAWAAGVSLHRLEPAAAIDQLTTALEVYRGTQFRSRLAEILLARGRARLATGDPAGARRDFEDGLAIFEDQRPEIREEQLRISRTSELWGLYEEALRLDIGDKAQALATAERSRARALLDSLAVGHDAPPLRGTELSAWLPDGVTALEFASLSDRLLRFEVSNHGVRLDELPIGRAALERLVGDYLQDVKAGRVAPALAAILLPRELSLRADTPLVILPDGPLHALPFGTLQVPGTTRLLVESSVPVIAPSLTTLRLSTEGAGDTSSRSGRVVLVAAPDPREAEGLPALDGARREIEELVRLYDRRASRLEGTHARRLEVLRAIGDASVLHFAGHAVTNSLHPSRSRLLLPGADTTSDLTARDLNGLAVRPGLVAVLAACSTAAGPVASGEGPISLARPFLAAGAAAVVASLWPISDEQSTSMLVEFHRRLREGTPPARALAESQRRALGAAVPAKVWAAFASYGGLK